MACRQKPGRPRGKSKTSEDEDKTTKLKRQTKGSKRRQRICGPPQIPRTGLGCCPRRCSRYFYVGKMKHTERVELEFPSPHLVPDVLTVTHFHVTILRSFTNETGKT